MPYVQKDNTGTIFKNDRREKDSQPHATGSAMIDGVEYYVSAWTKDGPKGKYQSLAFKRKDQGRTASQMQHGAQSMYDDADAPF